MTFRGLTNTPPEVGVFGLGEDNGQQDVSSILRILGQQYSNNYIRH